MSKNIPQNITDEGYVKFNSQHQEVEWGQEKLTINAELMDKIKQIDLLRTDLFDAGYIGLNENEIGYGNVSIRYFNELNPDSEKFIISATSTGGARELGLDGYCLVTDYNILNNQVICMGPLPASSETMSHAAIYHVCKNVNCVVHIHNKFLFEGLLLQENVLKTPKSVAYGTVQMAQCLSEIAQNNPLEACIVMEGHQDGIIFYGLNINQVRRLISIVNHQLLGF